MSNPLPHDMIEATRLTRAGRLREATALLRTVLSGKAFRAANPAEGEAKPASIALRAPVVDLVAGSDGVFGVEASAGADDAVKADPKAHPLGPPLGLFGGLDLKEVPQALRGLRKRRSPRPADIAPAGGTFVAGTFGNEAGCRTYKLYVPSRWHGEPRPLIVMLHGCTQSANDFAAGTRMNFAAEERACFVVYPEQAVSANPSKCWNWFESRDQKRGQGEPSLIAGIARQVMAEYGADPRRIYIAGLSAGGAAAAIVGEAYPDLVAGVGVHSGLPCGVARDLPSAFAAMRGGQAPRQRRRSGHPNEPARNLPTIVFHGDRDATVHPSNGDDVISRSNGRDDLRNLVEHGEAAGYAYTRTIRSDGDGRAMFEHWVVHGAGHAWSGGNPAGSFADPKGPDATKEMLRFFLDQSLPRDDAQ